MRRKGQQAENDKTERVTGLGRRTREAIAKWNQMTALRFHTGGRHQTSPASLRGVHRKSGQIVGRLPSKGDSALLLSLKWWSVTPFSNQDMQGTCLLCSLLITVLTLGIRN